MNIVDSNFHSLRKPESLTSLKPLIRMYERCFNKQPLGTSSTIFLNTKCGVLYGKPFLLCTACVFRRHFETALIDIHTQFLQPGAPVPPAATPYLTRDVWDAMNAAKAVSKLLVYCIFPH
jgi:hypothetical protein